MMKATSVLLVILAASCGGSKGGKGGACDRRLELELTDIATLPRSHRFSATAAVTAENCKLPPPILAALEDIARSSDCLGAAKGIADAPDLFLRACPAGHDTLRVLQTHGQSEGMPLVVDRCELPRLGFATRDELIDTHHWACLMLGSMLYVALDDAGDSAAKKTARLIALDHP